MRLFANNGSYNKENPLNMVKDEFILPTRERAFGMPVLVEN